MLCLFSAETTPQVITLFSLHFLLTIGLIRCTGADDVSKVLSSVGVEAEKDRLDTLIKALEGKKLHELIAAGSSKLSTLSGE